jgi:hypothetical protein
MKSSAKAKSFHVAVRGSSPQHVTLPSRLLIRLPADERLGGGHQTESSAEPPTRNHRIINGPPTGHQDIESSTLPLQGINRAILRAIRRASRRHGAANEPPRYSQAAGPPPGLRRTNRRRDTRKPPGRRPACVERTAAAILASRQAAAGRAPNDPPKRRKRDDGRSGTETEGYARGSRV